MCGGLAAGLGLSTTRSQTIASDAPSPFPKLLAYNLGRIISYCLAGLVVGTMGFWLAQQLSALTLLRYLAAVMLILMGLYLAQWFNGIVFTEQLGQYLWRFIQPLGKRFLPINNAKDALGVGLVWGWLPCGLVYSALIWASAEANTLGSMLIMLCFGLGTLPSMLTTGLFSQQLSSLIKQQWFRSSAGLLMIGYGVWTLPVVQRLISQHFFA